MSYNLKMGLKNGFDWMIFEVVEELKDVDDSEYIT